MASTWNNLPLSPWFPPGVQPARAGAYQVSSQSDPDARDRYADLFPLFAYFDGQEWGVGGISPDLAEQRKPGSEAHRNRRVMVNLQIANHRHWRGLAEEPNHA